MPTDPRPRIAWDVDDVLNDLTSEWMASEGLSAPRWDAVGEPSDFVAAANVDQRDYLISLDRFRFENYQDLEPSPLILDWLLQYGSASDHLAISKCPLNAAPTVSTWVLRHFGRWIRWFIVVPSSRPSDPPDLPVETKGSLLSCLRGPVLLVDDAPSNLRSLEGTDVNGVLYARAWNGQEDPHASLSECSQWLSQATRQSRIRVEGGLVR